MPSPSTLSSPLTRDSPTYMHVACIEHATVLQANVCMDGRAIHTDVHRPIANTFKGGLHGCLMCISMEEYRGVFGHAPPEIFFNYLL